MLEIAKNILNDMGYTYISETEQLRNYVSSLDIIEFICQMESALEMTIPDENACIFGDSLVEIIGYISGFVNNEQA